MSGVSLTEEQRDAIIELIDMKIAVALSGGDDASHSYQDLQLALQDFHEAMNGGPV